MSGVAHHRGWWLALALCVLAVVGFRLWFVAPPSVTWQQASAHLPFVFNAGQIANPEVAYYASTAHGPVYVNRGGEIFYLLPRHGESPQWVLKERLVGATARTPRARDTATAVVSHFIGNKPHAWKPGQPTFESLDWGEVYPDVQLLLRVQGCCGCRARARRNFSPSCRGAMRMPFALPSTARTRCA